MVQSLKNTGLFSKAIDLWEDKPKADQTLTNFHMHFHKVKDYLFLCSKVTMMPVPYYRL
jgi:hypothetical protein